MQHQWGTLLKGFVVESQNIDERNVTRPKLTPTVFTEILISVF